VALWSADESSVEMGVFVPFIGDDLKAGPQSWVSETIAI
jgi:hypothetical protein